MRKGGSSFLLSGFCIICFARFRILQPALFNRVLIRVKLRAIMHTESLSHFRVMPVFCWYISAIHNCRIASF
ncbi:hypothetical protein JZ751_025710 [Albula glossodonta]|uniref:Uncharacterized protein n=1 Tax=Albula glossodonta TaxID=121402 RepID=A0A8T2NFE6_9TELE|nr:hypothetical protein JZ751_025710 [Albula glossodonta]